MSETDQADPQPLMRGRFSLYETPSGGYHVAYQADGEDETRHLEIPGQALKMARMLSEGGNPMAMMSKMLGKGRGDG